MYSEEDKFAAWLILQSAEQGRPEEFIAQNIASLIQTMGGDPFEEFTLILGKISYRVGELLQNDGELIWQHLQAGGHQGDPLPWEVVEQTDWKAYARDMVANDNNELMQRIPYYIRDGLARDLERD